MKSMLQRSAKVFAAALASLALAGCANNAVVFSTATRTGVEINAAEGGQQGAHVGFERFEGVMMPAVYTNKTGDEVPLKQAYPVYAEYEFQSGGLTAAGTTNSDGGLIIRQAFATGKAATNSGVQQKIRDDFKALGGSLIDTETLDHGRKLIGLINNLGPGSGFSGRVINKINERLPSENPATNLDQAKTKVQRAANQRRTSELAQILKDLGL